MDKIRRIILLLIILVLTVIITILIILRNEYKGEKEYNQEIENSPEIIIQGIEPLKDYNLFYSISNCIQAYLNYNNLNLITRSENQEDKNSIVYDMLSQRI